MYKEIKNLDEKFFWNILFVIAENKGEKWNPKSINEFKFLNLSKQFFSMFYY